MDKLIIIGYGGHAKSVIDSVKSTNQYEIVGYTDLEDRNSPEIAYLGKDDELGTLHESGINHAFLGLGYMGKSLVRNKLYKQCKEIGFRFPVIADDSATIANNVQIGEGTYIGKRAVINSYTKIGRTCIINTGAIIEHENVIGDFTHVAVGATLCGNVCIASNCLIGANSTIIQGLSIGNNVIVGAGAVVTSDISDNNTVIGVPAKIVRR